MKRPAGDDPIRNYPLYGEARELPDILHHEEIQARASLHDWTIKPHRHLRLHQVFLILDKSGTVTIDGTVHTLEPPVLITLPARTVHGFSFEQGMIGHVVTLPMELADMVWGGRPKRS